MQCGAVENLFFGFRDCPCRRSLRRRGVSSGGVFLFLLPYELGVRAGDEVPSLMIKGLEFSVHCGFQSFHVLVARFLDVRFSRWRRSEVRFPGCLVRIHQRRRSCQLHRVLQCDVESPNKDHDQHRFVGCLDVLAVCLELREIPVEIIPVHLESAEFLG